jgi:hypothetical protein
MRNDFLAFTCPACSTLMSITFSVYNQADPRGRSSEPVLFCSTAAGLTSCTSELQELSVKCQFLIQLEFLQSAIERKGID